MLLGASKRPKQDSKTQEPVERVPVRISGALSGEMAAFYSPKKKSLWICEAIDDFLARETYQDADWLDGNNDDAASFQAMLDLDEVLVDQVPHVILMPQKTFESLTEAVKNISWLNPHESRSVRPAIIRAAIRQRILLNGLLFNDLF